MSQINFLPESFQRAHRRQQRRPAEFLVIAGTLVALAGLWLSMSGPDRALANQAEQLEQSLDEIAQLRAEQNRLFKERSSLQRKLLIARETYQPISATQVISRLSTLAPEPIRFIHVEMDVQRPEPQAIDPSTGNKKTVGKQQAKAIEPNLMKITITGHAPSDEQLVTLIRQMDADPVFTSVALRSSKQDKTKTHFVRAFRLDVVIDLDRRFIDTKGATPMRIESDVIKTASVVAILVATYAGVVFWPSQKQNQALADEIQNKQTELAQTSRPDLEPTRQEIVSLRAELRERAVELPKGDLDDRVLHHVSDTLIRRGVTLYETSYRDTKTYKRFSMTPIDVSFETDFTNAFAIIKTIENDGPPVRVERLIVGAPDGTANGRVKVTMQLSSFFEPSTGQGGQR